MQGVRREGGKTAGSGWSGKASRKRWASGWASKGYLCREEEGRPSGWRKQCGKTKGGFSKSVGVFNKHVSFDYLNVNEK